MQQLADLKKIAQRNPDPTHAIPQALPVKAPKSTQYRFAETSMYPYLHSNIDAGAMAFSQEPIPEVRSRWSIEKHGPDTPFRFWKVLEKYIAGNVDFCYFCVRDSYDYLRNPPRRIQLL